MLCYARHLSFCSLSLSLSLSISFFLFCQIVGERSRPGGGEVVGGVIEIKLGVS